MNDTFLSAARALLDTTLRASEANMAAAEAGFREEARQHRHTLSRAAECARAAINLYLFSPGAATPDYEGAAMRTLTFVTDYDTAIDGCYYEGE